MSASSSHDSDDLEALFDSIVDTQASAAPAAKAAAKPKAKAAAGKSTPAMPAASGEDHVKAVSPVAILAVADEALHTPVDANTPVSADLISRIGHLTRSLHDSLRELGFDKNIEKAAASIPDTRDRLAYVASMTGQAADKVLTLTESALPLQEAIGFNARALSQRWQQLMDNQLSVEEFKALVGETRSYLDEAPRQAYETSRHLRDIMVAQDFHDLTGQVIRKITEVAHRMEGELLNLLVENVSPEARAEAEGSCGLMNGPVISANGRGDVVTSQEQVDEMLASLGF